MNRSGRLTGRALIAVVLTAGCFLVIGSGSAAAQGTTGGGASTGRFFLGPIGWTPTLLMPEAGVDSNIYNVPATQKRTVDRYAVFRPQVDGVLSLGIAELSGRGAATLNYFQEQTTERGIDGLANVVAEFPVRRFRPTLGLAWQRARERSGNEIDLRVPRLQVAGTAGITTRTSTRTSLTLGGTITRLTYDRKAVFRDVSVAESLSRRTTAVDARFRLDVSPLTFFLIDVRGSRNDFVLVPGRQTDSLQGTIGLEFAPDAIVRGRLSMGFHKQVPRGVQGTPYFGFMSAVDLSYSLLGRTRFDGRFARDLQYSVVGGEEFFLSTASGLEVTHNLIGPVDVSVRVSGEKLDYTLTLGGPAPRIDYAETLGGGASIRLTQQSRFAVNLDSSRRRSTGGAEFEYVRHKLFASVTFGF